MSYFRRQFSSFEEFQRESFHEDIDLGKEELELLMELEAEEELHVMAKRGRHAGRE